MQPLSDFDRMVTVTQQLHDGVLVYRPFSVVISNPETRPGTSRAVINSRDGFVKDAPLGRCHTLTFFCLAVSFRLAISHLASAALRAISLRSGVPFHFAAVLFPPFLPSSTAARFFFGIAQFL
jgi:hypothetical protein